MQRLPFWQTLSSRLTIIFLVLTLLLAGCGRVQNQRFAPPAEGVQGVQVQAQLPDTLVMGEPAPLQIRLLDEDGSAIEGATVQVEGNMTHAGMEPVLPAATEVEPGHYQAELEWTMSGQWFVTVHATLPDGREIEHTLRDLRVRLQ